MLHQWENVTPDGNVRVLRYSFGPGLANSFAARLPDRSWAVVSPCCGAPESALDALGSDGGVSALVANNGFHHMGQPAWRKRFPQAVSYAPTGSLPRLGAKSREVPYRPLDELTPALAGLVEFVVPAGMKVADLIVRAANPVGDVWFMGDLVSNTGPGDTKAPFSWIFGMLGGGTGYRFNPVPAMVFVKDKAAWKADVRQRVEAAPLAAVVPAHGATVRDNAADATRAVLR